MKINMKKERGEIMTGYEFIQKLKKTPYEEWIEAYRKAEIMKLGLEDGTDEFIFTYIETARKYTPELEILFQEYEREQLKKLNAGYEKILFNYANNSKNQSEQSDSKFNKIFSSFKSIFLF